MSLALKAVYSMLTGAWGALLAWALLDLLLGWRPESPYLDALLNGAVIGLAVGVWVNGFNGLLERRPWPLLRGVLVGTVAGLVGGVGGLLIGEALYQLLGRGDVWRVAGWAIFGLGVGLSPGLLSLSWRKALYGGAGGLLGGMLGGLAFALLRHLASLPLTRRAFGFALLGALVGLLMGLVPIVFRRAWLKVITSGRNEGKERIIDKACTRIGRNDALEFPLYGDKSVAPQQAEIRREGGRYVLHRLAAGPLTVDGAPVAGPVPLGNGTRIGVGREVVLFRQR